MKKIITVLSLIVLSAGKAYAGEGSYEVPSNCVPVYGGGVTCPKPGEVLVDKKVRNPATGIYVDNLGVEDPKYKPQQVISFQITVKNPGEVAMDRITLTDTLPRLFDYISGPGAYNPDNGTITWTVDNLGPGETQVFEVTGRTSHPAKFPENVICPTADSPHPMNSIDAVASSGQKDHDDARYCLEREITLPQGETPKAGPENWLLSITGLLASAYTGLKLRKKSR